MSSESKSIEQITSKAFASFAAIFQRSFMDTSNTKMVIAFSGGADSTFLLHTLIAYLRSIDVSISNIVAVYVDHGWRQESAQEAVILKEKSALLGIQYYSKKISYNDVQDFHISKNKEDIARKGRYLLLKSVCDAVSSRHLFLGHHFDDQTETIFKRFLEGSALQLLQGMSSIQKHRSEAQTDIYLLRPLLLITKNEIEQWLSYYKISYLTDSTNSDPGFLRNKMRSSIFPLLRTHFGKDFTCSITRLSQEAARLRHYIERVYNNAVSFIGRKNEAFALQAKHGNIDPFVIEQLIHSLKTVSPKLSSFSRDQIVDVVDSFYKKDKERVYCTKWGTILSSHQRIMFFPKAWQPYSQSSGLSSVAFDSTTKQGTSSWNTMWSITWHYLPYHNHHGEKFKTDIAIKNKDDDPIWLSLLNKKTVQVCFFALSSCAQIEIRCGFEKDFRNIEKEYLRFSLLRKYIPAIFVDGQLAVCFTENHRGYSSLYLENILQAEEFFTLTISISCIEGIEDRTRF